MEVSEIQAKIQDIIDDQRPEGWDEYTKTATAALADIKRACGEIRSDNFGSVEEYAKGLAEHLLKWLEGYNGPVFFGSDESTGRAAAASGVYEITGFLNSI